MELLQDTVRQRDSWTFGFIKSRETIGQLNNCQLPPTYPHLLLHFSHFSLPKSLL